MAEIDLVSSHMPWAPLPTMVPWNKVGNGSIFDPMPAHGETPALHLGQRQQARRAFAKSIQYSMMALTSWVTELNDPNLVLILLGDEQPAHRYQPAPGPATRWSISIIARDPSVFRQIASWRWQDGLLPESLRSARANGRLPQPVPRRLQHGLVPSGVGPSTTQHPNRHGEQGLRAVTSSPVAPAFSSGVGAPFPDAVASRARGRSR